MAEKSRSSSDDRYREMARRAWQRRAVLDGESVEILKEHMCECPNASPSRSAAWARLWARLLAPAERAASDDAEAAP